MFDMSRAEERCATLIAFAQRFGADAADAVAIGDMSEGVQVRLGALEDVERSESEAAGLRVFVGQRSASIHASDLSDAALSALAERAVDMARAATEDQFAGLAPRDMLARGPFADLDLEDSSEPTPQQLRAMAQEAEDAARAVQGVTNSEGGSAGFGRSVVALATSDGFSGGYAATSHSISASVVAGTGSGMQRDYAWRQARHATDLLPPADIGRLAGERAVARLEPGRLPSKVMPVVFSPRVSNGLLGHLVGAMSGASIARRSSFLLDRLDDTLFDSSIVILDDPHRLRGLRSRPFDGEGLPTAARTLVEGGKITGWLADSASARQLGILPTGHAVRGAGGGPGISVSNVHLAAGTASPDDLMSDVSDGVYVTELFGHGVNGVTGDYSRGASGFRIVDGALAGPVAEFTIAGNLLDMFAAMIPANDLEMHRGMNAPTVRIDGMTIAGD
ncbi:putative protein PmbA [Caenibius tardaugens NBRC 16725]|uniref:PmbA protein n=1 Tax=Caenibius tardaugens NBRC 16725 TaxID=1219035 RepID=U3A105_9SPHN|nr:metallopeptidase TldD-related protein [Caenibius tardaugens]AZI34906.1 TldD/PmbA family protein [Caenibius tardaugens NBRC 16725]GAD48443.1 putative protein PmbA [Caenibius tardaugens NBRC 16725]